MKDTERQCSINTCRLVAERAELTQFLWGSCEQKGGTYYLCKRCIAAFTAFVALRFDPAVIEVQEKEATVLAPWESWHSAPEETGRPAPNIPESPSSPVPSAEGY